MDRCSSQERELARRLGLLPEFILHGGLADLVVPL